MSEQLSQRKCLPSVDIAKPKQNPLTTAHAGHFWNIFCSPPHHPQRPCRRGGKRRGRV